MTKMIRSLGMLSIPMMSASSAMGAPQTDSTVNMSTQTGGAAEKLA